MADQIGDWIREPRTADCPQCASDSMPVRRINDELELRRCVDDRDHEFEAQAYEIVAHKDATRFDL